MVENASRRGIRVSEIQSVLERWAIGQRARRALQIVVDMLLLWRERERQRRALAMLSDDLLKDIGVTRLEAGREWDKRQARD